MTEAEKWTGYNLAEAALNIVASHYSAIIFTEKKRDVPDQVQIKKWISERTKLSRLKQTLTVDDMATIERVNEEYGPKAKAIMRKE